MSPISKIHRSVPANKENHSIGVSSKLHRYSSSASLSSSSASPVPDLANLQLHHFPPRTNCHDPVSWTLDHSSNMMDDDCQAAEILTSIMMSNHPNTIGASQSHDEPNIIQSDSMDGHVDPVSCQLMQVDEFDEDEEEEDDLEGRDEVSGQAAYRNSSYYNNNHHHHHVHQYHYQDQSPPAPRSLTPSETVQRPQAHRLQLFPMPSNSYSYDEE